MKKILFLTAMICCYLTSFGQKYLAAAQQGDAEAQFKLGKSYYRGKDGATKDFAKAAEWFYKAAMHGHVKAIDKLNNMAILKNNADAKYYLGNCYENGYVVRCDLNKAMDWYRAAANQGNANAQFRFGKYIYENNNKNGAMEWFRKAADQGHSTAAYYIGDFQRAAELGNAEAQYKLGKDGQWKYSKNYDKAKSAEWFSKAAVQGHAKAQYELGKCYFYGDGLTQDKSKAVEWLSKAAEQDIIEAQYELGICYLNGDGVTQDKAKAVELFKSAAEQNILEAQYELGKCYFNGDGVTQNKAKAAEWYQWADNNGWVPATFELGKLYYYGDGVTQLYSIAERYFQNVVAKEPNNDEARDMLAKARAKVKNEKEEHANAEKAVMDNIRSQVEQLKRKYGAAIVNDMMKTGEIKVGHTMAFLNDYAKVYVEYQRARTPYMNGIGSDAFKRYNLEFRTKEPSVEVMIRYGNNVKVVNTVSNVIGVEATFYIVNSKVVGVYAGGLGTMDL